jgi:hypothetical protein
MLRVHLMTKQNERYVALCGRQLSRPTVGQQVQPHSLATDTQEVTCGWCLQLMATEGMPLTEQQRPLVAQKSVPRKAEAEEEEEEVEA